MEQEEYSTGKRSLKIGNDHRPAQHIESKVKVERWSPDAIMGNIRVEGLQFDTTIYTKTVYNYIDKGIFAEISNEDLWVKKDRKKRNYKKIRTVALNNRNGKARALGD